MSKVLLVDDSSSVRMIIRQVFVSQGYNDILEAGNGLAALELYKANRPTLTILDIIMPELDGVSTLREIMSFDPTAKVIMCSAVAQGNFAVEALELGALDFLVKPFDVENLKEIIAKYLSPSQVNYF